MTKDTTKTKVIFRIWPDGDVIALFPELPFSYDPRSCMSYMHIGQHGEASASLSDRTKPATPEQYKDLFNELENAIGYNLQIIKKSGPSHLQKRLDGVNKSLARSL